VEQNPLPHGELSNVIEKKQRLDCCIVYLRTVHCMCYYCGAQFVNEDQVKKKCGEIHMRVGISELTVKNNWIEELDKKLKKRIDQGTFSADIYTGKDAVEKCLQEFYRETIIKLDVEKYRCGKCNKLFCGEDFVRKHLNLKHVELIKDLKQKAFDDQYFKNYMADAARPMPNYEPSPERSYPSRSREHRSPNRSDSSISTRGRKSGRIDRRTTVPLEPPPGAHPDPRSSSRINYVDLDAPEETPVVIDYRTSITYDEEESFANVKQ